MIYNSRESSVSAHGFDTQHGLGSWIQVSKCSSPKHFAHKYWKYVVTFALSLRNYFKV